MSSIIANKYELLEKIGEGNFGKIFIGKNQITQELIAIKIDELNSNIMLKNEARIYKLLNNIKGIPNMRNFGIDGKYQYLILDLLDKNLEQYKVENKDNFDMKKVINYGLQMFERIEAIHDVGIIHRDIKPENFVAGLNNNKNLLYLIDFGLSKLYKKNNEHIPYSDNKEMIGTAKFVSINIHKGITPTRRDDLESIIYVLIYLCNGSLPWLNIQSDNIKDKYKLIQESKETVQFWNIPNIPGEFILIMNYIRSLDFFDKPDYKYIRSILLNLYNHKYYNLTESIQVNNYKIG